MKPSSCTACNKPPNLCVCAEISAALSPIRSKHAVLVLQHPQEPREFLSSSFLLPLLIQSAHLRVGLSAPNLRAALKSSIITGEPNPKEWGVFFLGSIPLSTHSPGLYEIRGKTAVPFSSRLSGIVLLDGTWAQSKTLWWRNPWLTKLKRLALVPRGPSLYGRLRKEPKPECLSSTEAAAEALHFLGESEVSERLRQGFEELLKLAQTRGAQLRKQSPTSSS